METPESSPQVRRESEERERRLQQQVAALERELAEALQKVDEHRAKLAKMLNGNGESRLRFQLEYYQEHAARLETDLQVLEIAYVELAARLRRSD